MMHSTIHVWISSAFSIALHHCSSQHAYGDIHAHHVFSLSEPNLYETVKLVRNYGGHVENMEVAMFLLCWHTFVERRCGSQAEPG